jgi:hypothetical protein
MPERDKGIQLRKTSRPKLSLKHLPAAAERMQQVQHARSQVSSGHSHGPSQKAPQLLASQNRLRVQLWPQQMPSAQRNQANVAHSQKGVMRHTESTEAHRIASNGRRRLWAPNKDHTGWKFKLNVRSASQNRVHVITANYDTVSINNGRKLQNTTSWRHCAF